MSTKKILRIKLHTVNLAPDAHLQATLKSQF